MPSLLCNTFAYSCRTKIADRSLAEVGPEVARVLCGLAPLRCPVLYPDGLTETLRVVFAKNSIYSEYTGLPWLHP